MDPGHKVRWLNLCHSWWEDEKGRRIGALSKRMWNEAAESGDRLIQGLLPDADQRRDFIKQVQSELGNPEYHIYYPW